MTTRNQWARELSQTALAACLLLFGASAAAQEPGGVSGHVVELSQGDIVVDVAREQGAVDGAVLELWRPLTVKHPVTGQTLNDRFLIGRLRLVQVRGALSLARAEGKLSRAAEPGDVVIFRPVKSVAPAAPVAPQPAPGVSVAPAPAVNKPGAPCAEPKSAPSSCDPEALEVSALFDGLRGKDPRRRILAYEGYVRRLPRGRYAVVLYEEAQQLRKLVGLLSAGKTLESAPERRSFLAPAEALAGQGLEFGVEVDNVTGAVLHSRNAGEVAYVTLPMQAAGDGYYTVRIAASRVKAPRLEYFIEATTATGRAIPIVAQAGSPYTIMVEALPEPKLPRRRDAVASISTDYADWNNWKGNDVVWQTEGFVGMRLEDTGIRAVRTGFGVFRGVGGSLRDLDDLKLTGRAVGLTYGYLEGEFGLSHFTGLIGRLVVGLEDRGVVGGAQALLRLGNDRETNLQIGGEVLGNVGLRGITQLELNVFEKVPVLFRTEVTNQPAGLSREGEEVRPDDPSAAQDATSHGQSEVGGRAIAQVGYRLLPSLVASVRGSYQGRTINHAGPGFGGAVTYQW